MHVLIVSVLAKGIFITTGPQDLADALLNVEPEVTPWVGVWGNSEVCTLGVEGCGFQTTNFFQEADVLHHCVRKLETDYHPGR